jgi:hypothetical protein
MAQVVLQANWFGSDGARYRKAPGGFPTFVPDEIVNDLPTTARVVSMDDGSEPPAYRPRSQDGLVAPFPIRSAPPTGRPIDTRPVVKPDGETLRDFDDIRTSDDAIHDKVAIAVKEREAFDAEVAEKRRAGLEKARAAKAAKKAQETSSE